MNDAMGDNMDAPVREEDGQGNQQDPTQRSAASDDDDDDFNCRITNAPFQDPVQASDGFIYERRCGVVHGCQP